MQDKGSWSLSLQMVGTVSARTEKGRMLRGRVDRALSKQRRSGPDSYTLDWLL
jgi:hypothetical protein